MNEREGRVRAHIDRYRARGSKEVFSKVPLEEGKYIDGKFVPIYNENIYVDENCRFYRGSWVERKLVISQGVIRQLIDERHFYGYFRNNEFRVERESLLQYLDQNHFKRREEGEPPANYEKTREKKKRKESSLTLHPLRHDYLPELYGPSKVVDYILDTTLSDVQKGSLHRLLIRYTEEGYFSFYRISGSFRYSREDWLESLKRILTSEELRRPDYGRPTFSLFTILAPFLAVVIDQEGLDTKDLENYIESLKWRHVFSARTLEDKDLTVLKEEGEKMYGINPLYYLNSQDEWDIKMLKEIREELYPM